ncbi:MAG: peptide/nickel transport system substrate-binding protein [Thermomicrobiales bacterium]|nr:peptide/nickel transport system substrate-binding protein [Thermomicrobiales bacterium]
MAAPDQFETLFREFLNGSLTRRQAMLRGAGLGVGAAVVGALPVGRSGSNAALAQDGAPKPGGVLTMGMQSDPGGLDPQKQSLTALWHVVEHIYSRLTKVEPDLSIAPELAESWEISEDGLTYTFKLHQGVKFHNGREVVAGDVKYSYERLVDPAMASPSAADLLSMAGVEAPDNYTVVLTLKARDASILANLAAQSCIIIPKEVVEQNGDLAQVAVGSGPFAFKEYVPNTQITLERNPDYFEEGLPYLDGVELLIAAEDTSRTAALVQGSVDFIEYVPPKDIELLQGDSSIVLAGHSIQQIRMIGFNLRKEPFNNVKVRQAINAVVNRDDIVAASLQGHGTTTDIPFSQDFWPALKREVPPPDVEKAKQLMTEAGYADGFKTSITTWAEYGTIKDAAVVVQEQLKQIGIDAELNALPTGEMGQVVYVDFDFDMAVTGTSGFVDPHGVMLDFKTGESGNFVGYSNPEVDKLIDAGIAETDQAKRAEIYQQIQEILLQDLPWVNLLIGQQYEAMKTYVKGYEHIPTGSNLKVREVWLDK